MYLFSEDGSGQLTFQKFINMMSVFSGRTSRQTKAVWAFALWDFDGDHRNFACLAHSVMCPCRKYTISKTWCNLHTSFASQELAQHDYGVAGDDLLGPRDIKKGLHMLTNANIKTLEDEEDEEKDAQEDIDLEANRKKRVQKHDKTDTLTSEQMNQVQPQGPCFDICVTVHHTGMIAHQPVTAHPVALLSLYSCTCYVSCQVHTQGTGIDTELQCSKTANTRSVLRLDA